MARLALTWFLALILSAGAAIAQTAFAPAIIVNDDPITYYDIQQRAKILEIGGAPVGPETNAVAAEQLIDDRLRLQAGRRLQITASGDEIAEAATELASRQGLDRAGLVERVVRFGGSEEALIDLLRSQVIWRKVVAARFGSRAAPSEAELDQELALAAADKTRSFNLSEIIIVGDAGEAEVQRKLEAALSALDSGQSFEDVARRFSESPSATEGGAIGWVPENSIPANITAALTDIQPGTITAPLPVPGAVTLFRLNDRRVDASPLASDAQFSLVRLMVPLDENADDEAVAAARAEARKLSESSRGCDALPELSEEAAMERIPRSPLIEFPTSVQDAIRLLGPQQASRPVRNRGSMDVFVVCDRQGGVDQAVRDQLRGQIMERRLNRFSDGHLQELRRQAVIERR